MSRSVATATNDGVGTWHCRGSGARQGPLDQGHTARAVLVHLHLLGSDTVHSLSSICFVALNTFVVVWRDPQFVLPIAQLSVRHTAPTFLRVHAHACSLSKQSTFISCHMIVVR